MEAMTLQDRIFLETGSFLGGCIVWIPLALWIVALVHWMIGGEIDVLFGFAGILMAVVLGYYALVPPFPLFSILTLFAVTLTVIAFPFVRTGMTQKSLKAITLEDLEKAYAAARLNSTNAPARFRIAQLVYELGMPGHALRIAEDAIAGAPASFFMEERRIVVRWQRTPLQPTAFAPLPCPECGFANAPGNVHCGACSAPFLLLRARGQFLPGRMGKKLLAGWITMIIVMVAMPAVGSIGGVEAVVGIVALMAAAAGILVLAFLPPRKGVSS
jgi:hypothetical protein